MNYELLVKVPLQTLGQVGRVVAVVDHDGVVLVRIKDRVWAYSPLCLTPTPELATSIPTGINYSAVNWTLWGWAWYKILVYVTDERHSIPSQSSSYMHIHLPFTGGFESIFACWFTNLLWHICGLWASKRDGTERGHPWWLLVLLTVEGPLLVTGGPFSLHFTWMGLLTPHTNLKESTWVPRTRLLMSGCG